MLVPVFPQRKLYWADVPDMPLDTWYAKAEKLLKKSRENRDKSYDKLMNDRFITNMAEKGLWEDLELEEKKWSDSYWQVVNLENAIELMHKVHG